MERCKKFIPLKKLNTAVKENIHLLRRGYTQPITQRLLQLCCQDVKLGPINSVLQMPMSYPALLRLQTKNHLFFFKTKTLQLRRSLRATTSARQL